MSGVSVTLVLEPDFGARLSRLSASQIVWLLDSEVNEDARKRLDTERRSSVTTFTAEFPDKQAVLETALEMIEDHHDEYSEGGPWTELTVIGMPLTVEARALLEDYGVTSVRQVGSDIHAQKSA